LSRKRAELSAELAQAERRFLDLHAALQALDSVLRSLDPAVEPQAIKPRLKRSPPNRFKGGQFTRMVLDVLRTAEGPMSARDIANQLAGACDVDMTAPRPAELLIYRVRAVLRRPHDGVSQQQSHRLVWGSVV
jgi:hypothetical protein